MWDWVSGKEDLFIIIYCFIILWINLSYLKEHQSIKEGLAEASDEEELMLNPNSFSIMMIGLIFNFFRRWLLYILAFLLTGSIAGLIISLILFITSLYDTLFNYSLEKIKNSNLGYYLAIADTIFAVVFLIYLFT